MTNKDPKQLAERYASCPFEKNEYEKGGVKYTVTRHFTGEKSISRVVAELAISRAKREVGQGEQVKIKEVED